MLGGRSKKQIDRRAKCANSTVGAIFGVGGADGDCGADFSATDVAAPRASRARFFPPLVHGLVGVIDRPVALFIGLHATVNIGADLHPARLTLLFTVYLVGKFAFYLLLIAGTMKFAEIGRASCRERVCSTV